MEKFDFWKNKQKLDDYFFELVNIVLRFIFFVRGLTGKYQYLKKNIELKDMFKNQRCFLVANGPSINNQNLKPLSGEITFFLNRAYKHKDYEFIKPTFHILIDNKLATGEWDIDMIDVIIKKNPNVILLLNAKWYSLKKFNKYVNNNQLKIYWVDISLFTTPFHNKRTIDLKKITYGSGSATSVAFMSSIYMGISNFYFLL